MTFSGHFDHIQPEYDFLTDIRMLIIDKIRGICYYDIKRARERIGLKEKKKGFVAEFKEFISRGSVLDMAVGIIIGSAFTAIVTSLVNDVVMPFVGFLIGGVDFTEFKIVLSEATAEAPAAAIYYGKFIQQIINFLLIALVVFTMIKGINSLRTRLEHLAGKKEEEPAEELPPEPSEDIKLLTEIRDLLKKDK
jgi:large conductance mechanosensitive channel